MANFPIDVRASIARHPWIAVGIALAFGACIAFGERARSRLVRASALAAGNAVGTALWKLAVMHVVEHAAAT